MGKVFAVTNQKGGVGKTTTAINAAASLVRARRKVLLIDLDSQANMTVGIGVTSAVKQTGIYDVLVGRVKIRDAIKTVDKNFDMVAANRSLVGAQVELLGLRERESKLKNAIATVRDEYNFIILDCPPTLNIITINALVAADSVIVPTQCEFFALQGLVDLLDTIDKVRKTLNPRLNLDGILRTMHDRRNKLNREVSEQLCNHFGSQVYRTVIPRNIKLAEAPSHGESGLSYDKNCAGTIAYMAFAGELLNREERHETTG